jgi:hypothetical protein
VNIYTRAVSIITSASFLFSFILAQPLEAIAATQLQGKRQYKEKYSIPSYIGRITDKNIFDSGTLVINIQDLHCHPEVQRNIAKILAFLTERYNPQKIYVEGASGEVDTSWLCNIKDDNLKRDIIETLVDQGKLTGAEYYSVMANRPAVLSGLENKDLHRENIIRLEKIIQNRSRYEQVCRELEEDFAFLNKKFFRRSNAQFEELVDRYRKGKIGAGKYYQLLRLYAEKANSEKSTKIDFKRYKNIEGWLSHSISVNPMALIREEKELAGEIRKGLSRDKTEREVSLLASYLESFEDYLNVRISGQDYDSFAKNLHSFQILWDKYNKINRLLMLSEDIAFLERYYQVNVQRNAIFYQKILQENKNDGQPGIIIAITGGFHSDGLAKLLAGRNISYLTITPNITEETQYSDRVYASRVEEQAKIFSQTLALILYQTIIVNKS